MKLPALLLLLLICNVAKSQSFYKRYKLIDTLNHDTIKWAKPLEKIYFQLKKDSTFLSNKLIGASSFSFHVRGMEFFLLSEVSRVKRFTNGQLWFINSVSSAALIFGLSSGIEYFANQDLIYNYGNRNLLLVNISAAILIHILVNKLTKPKEIIPIPKSTIIIR